MARYRCKPIEVDMVQWLGHGNPPVEGLFAISDRHTSGKVACPRCQHGIVEHGSLMTQNGIVPVCPGDWIIADTDGVPYPCKPSVQAAKYERVGELDAAAFTPDPVDPAPEPSEDASDAVPQQGAGS